MTYKQTLLFIFLFLGFKSAYAGQIPRFATGENPFIFVCQNSIYNNLNSVLTIDDADTGETEAWTITSYPQHGSLNGFPYSMLSTGYSIVPASLTYTPNIGFNGIDSFTIQISDGDSTSQTLITVTVEPAPDAGIITGDSAICLSSFVYYSDSSVGGIWSSGNPSIAFVGASGTVTGVSGGTAIISYTIESICGSTLATKEIRVIPPPVPGIITGPTDVCLGSAATFSSTNTEGFWQSSNYLIANIDTLGFTTFTSVGNATISYIISNSCFSDTARHPVSVYPVPNAGSISGRTTLCVGDTTTLMNTSPGGYWTTDSAAITIGDTTGIVTAVARGRAIVTYTITNGCGSAITKYTINVNEYPILSSTLYPPDILSGSSMDYLPVSSLTGTVFHWVRLAIPNISNPTDSGYGNPAEILYDTTLNPVIVFYKYTLDHNGCLATYFVQQIVQPLPGLIDTAKYVICSGEKFTDTIHSNIPGTITSWKRNYHPGINPATSSGVGNFIDEVLINNTDSLIKVHYTIYLSLAGHSVPQDLVVGVDSPPPAAPRITSTSPSWVCLPTMYQNFGTDSLPANNVKYEWLAKGATVWSTGHNAQYCLVNFTQPGWASIYLYANKIGSNCKSKDSFVVAVNPATNDNAQVIYDGENFICLNNSEKSYQWGYDNKYTLAPAILTAEHFQNYFLPNPDFTNKSYWVITDNGSCRQKSYYNEPLKIDLQQAGPFFFSVYPNPNQGAFIVSTISDYNEEVRFVITDLIGKKIAEWNGRTNNQAKKEINLANGAYLIMASTIHENRVIRLVVSN